MSETIYEKNRILYKYNNANESVKMVPTDVLQMPFDDQTYEFGSTMTASFSTGEYYVDATKSYVNIEVELTGDGVNPMQANWGYGSCSNLWNAVRIYHRSGTLISQAQNIDLWKKADDTLAKDAFWYSTVGFIAGYRSDPSTDLIWDGVGPEKRSFKIKLCDLHPFFKGKDQKIIPKEIINDLRIELDINSVQRAIFTTGGPNITAASVSKCNLQVAVVDLMDEAQDVVSDMANKEGLNWSFSDVFITSKIVAQNENNINISVDKAVSAAQNVMTFARPSDADGFTTVDSYKYQPMSGGISWNYRIQNQLYPYKRAVDNRFDTYTTAIDCYEWNYGHNMTYTEFEDHNQVYLTCLKTDDHIESSGEYLNANKKIELELNKGTSASDRFVHIALQYNKLLNVNTVNSRLDE
jgi:hypothetical protein